MELMFGKVLGLGAVGLTLIGAWGACGGLIAMRAGSLPIEPGMAGVFSLYFFPGFFFYAAVLASVGSVCNSEREAQPFLTPISMMLIFPVMIGFVIAQSPDHLLARVFSFIPFFTPSLMLFRFAIKEPPAWEIAATWGVLMVSTVGMIWASSRIFRVGILMYGKRPTIPEIIRWVGAK
jgi:ABC-2 type transport system permease protein